MAAKSLFWRLIEQRHCDAMGPGKAGCDNLLRRFLRPWVIAVTLTRLEVAFRGRRCARLALAAGALLETAMANDISDD